MSSVELRTKGGRGLRDVIGMCKMIALSAVCAMPDEQGAYRVRDRLSVIRFLRIKFGNRVSKQPQSGFTVKNCSGLRSSKICSRSLAGTSETRGF